MSGTPGEVAYTSTPKEHMTEGEGLCRLQFFRNKLLDGMRDSYFQCMQLGSDQYSNVN